MLIAPISIATARGSGRAAPGMAEAVAVTERFLSDGAWRATSAVRLIAFAYHCSHAAVCEVAALADSEIGRASCRERV